MSLTSTAAPPRETLLCIHASAVTGRAFKALAAQLPHLNVLAFDRLGCASERPWLPGMRAPLLAEAEHFLPVLQAHPEGVHVFGHSFGGAVALEIALRFPERVKSLTVYEPVRFAWLFDAPLERAADLQAASQVLHVGRSVMQWVHAGRQADAAERFVDYWSGEGTWAQMDARRREGVIATMPKVAAEFDAAFNDRTPLNALWSLSMPLCFMGGDASPASVQCIVRLMGECAGHARREQLRGLGHMAPVTHAEQVARRLPRWLRAPEGVQATEHAAVPMAA